VFGREVNALDITSMPDSTTVPLRGSGADLWRIERIADGIWARRSVTQLQLGELQAQLERVSNGDGEAGQIRFEAQFAMVAALAVQGDTSAAHKLLCDTERDSSKVYPELVWLTLLAHRTQEVFSLQKCSSASVGA